MFTPASSAPSGPAVTPFHVTCPTCHAAPDHPCRMGNRSRALGATHESRRLAARVTSGPRPYRRPPASTPHLAQLARTFDRALAAVPGLRISIATPAGACHELPRRRRDDAPVTAR